MVTGLEFGLVFTFLAWVALMVVVWHGKYVTEKISDGSYEKGPFGEDYD